jgi:FMN phosphatase YigB (HAD superfamily)
MPVRFVALAASQPAYRMAELRRLGIDADLMLSSEAWGVEKPAPEFFARLVAAADLRIDSLAVLPDAFSRLPPRDGGAP